MSSFSTSSAMSVPYTKAVPVDIFCGACDSRCSEAFAGKAADQCGRSLEILLYEPRCCGTALH